MAAKKDDVVKVHYTGKLDDGQVFDTSVDKEPLTLTLGGGGVIPGFDNAIIGMEINDKKEVHIPCDEAYGQKKDELVITVPKKEFPDDFNPKIGDSAQLKNEKGKLFNVIIVKVDDKYLYLDANHPLAGKDLNFEIELLEIL